MLSPHAGNPARGIACVIAAGACFAVLDSAAKTVAMVVPVLMALWVRYLIQALCTSAVLLPRHGRPLLRTAHPILQVLRGGLLVLSTTLAFLCLRTMPVGEFTAIAMVTPMMVTLLAATVLRQRVAPMYWVFLIGGFLGTLLIVRPGGQGDTTGALLALACMLANSVFQLLTSHLARSDSPATTHFYTGWVGTALATLALPFTWAAVDSPWLWSLMAFMGVMAAIGHFILATAYQHAPAATLMPYMYCHVGFAVAASWLFFAHVPDGWTFAGIALIAVCGAGGAWYTARQRRLPVPLRAA